MPQITYNGVTFNFVTVTGQLMTLTNGAVGPCSGNLQFNATDLAFSVQLGMIGYMPQLGVTLDTAGAFSAQLFAMDNTSVSTNWSWTMSGTINGYPLPKRNIVVRYANGDTQTLETVLALNGGAVLVGTLTLAGTSALTAVA